MSVTQFNQILGQKIKELIPVQTVWAVVKDVDWENKTMTATGEIDDLDYYDVLLGIGDHYHKPKIGAKCLIGSIGNSANTFLFSADEVEETIFKRGDSELTIKAEGFIIKQSDESLKKVLNDMIDEINKIIVINGTSINVPAMTAIKQRLNTVLIE
ncbi:MAG: hypothetical protein REI96_06335 [Flavobacterium nitrogenifigens]|uniref:hypothetical protein n=1 Tax=Flavobacterium nitrogenifigens TaxID=1617283 RepID=UPI002807ECFA|nr:hypothetical protein [Flavobacterium nitrogenifigens]MDQ8012045.1 hypothetical protein [Flavobacterium nitrogenifigens]